MSATSSQCAAVFVDAFFRPLDIPISSSCLASPRSLDQVLNLSSTKKGIMWLGGWSTSRWYTTNAAQESPIGSVARQANRGYYYCFGDFMRTDGAW